MDDPAAREERHRLDSIAAVSLYGVGVNPATIAHSFQIFRRHLRPG
jgi:hypothetical protein